MGEDETRFVEPGLDDHRPPGHEEPLAAFWSALAAPAEVDADERAREIGGLPVTGPVTFADALSRIHPDDRPRVRAALANAFDAGSLYVEEFRIAQYADDHSILFVPHGWNTAVGLAADLQLVAAAGNARWVEYITPAPYIEDLCETPPVLDAGGYLAIPAGPGLGFRWNPDGIARHTGGLALTPSVL